MASARAGSQRRPEQPHQAQQQPEWLAGQAFRELVYGKQNRLGQPSDGVPADVAKLTLADVKHFYQAYYNPTNAKVVVVGDVGQKQIEEQLGFLTEWKGGRIWPSK
jgi:zinc protease